jgi:hypothetical protein
MSSKKPSKAVPNNGEVRAALEQVSVGFAAQQTGASHLPTGVTRLIGRRRELRELRDLLLRDDVKLVSLTAPSVSAVRPPFDSLSPLTDTEQISWGKLSRLPCTAAESTLRTLMDMDFAVAHSSGTGALYPVLVHRLAPSIHASFRPHLAASLGLHLHQVGQRTFTSKLLSMPSTQRSRSHGRRCACLLVEAFSSFNLFAFAM